MPDPVAEPNREARVEAGDATVSSEALSKRQIAQFVDRQKASILLCYKRAVQKDPSLAGKLTVEFTVSPTGKVLRPRVAQSTLHSEVVEGCVTSRMLRWRFPEPGDGEAVTVTYPFTFLTR